MNHGDDKEQAFLAAAREVLDGSVDQLDAQDLSRLRAARLRALAGVGTARRRAWVPMTAVAAAAIGGVGVYVALSVGAGGPGARAVAAASVEDLDLLGGREDIQFYQDLDFYRWLDREQGDDAG